MVLRAGPAEQRPEESIKHQGDQGWLVAVMYVLGKWRWLNQDPVLAAKQIQRQLRIHTSIPKISNVETWQTMGHERLNSRRR